MEKDERVYTLQEAAERLKMPYRTLRDAVFRGRWPHRKISERRRLMTESDVQWVLAFAHAPAELEGSPFPERSESDSRRDKAEIRELLRA